MKSNHKTELMINTFKHFNASQPIHREIPMNGLWCVEVCRKHMIEIRAPLNETALIKRMYSSILSQQRLYKYNKWKHIIEEVYIFFNKSEPMLRIQCGHQNNIREKWKQNVGAKYIKGYMTKWCAKIKWVHMMRKGRWIICKGIRKFLYSVEDVPR